MFKPEEMCKVNILLLDRHASEVTRRLGREGVVHLVDAVTQSPGHLLSALEDSDSRSRASSALEKCRQLMLQLDVDPAQDTASVPSRLALDEIVVRLEAIRAAYDVLNGKIAALLQDVNGLSMQKNRLDAYPVQNVSLDSLRSLSHLQIFTGSLPAAELGNVREALKELAVMGEVDGREGCVLVVCAQKCGDAVSGILDNAGFVRISAPEGFNGTAEDEGGAVEGKLSALRAQLEGYRSEVRALGDENREELYGIARKLSEEVSMQDIRSHYGRLKSLVCISGWVPRASLEVVRREVSAATNGSGVVEVTAACDDARVKAGAEQVPTKMSNHALARFFRSLIQDFSVPRYNEVDPTFFLGLTYVLLFGYMFGDVGHGLVLALAGLALKFGRHKLADSVRDSGVMLMLCGACSVVFGFAYGSIFGYEEAFKALWLSPMHDIGTLLLTAIGVGTVFTSAAIIINIVNHIKSGEYYEGAFQRFGLMGLLFFWVCLGIGVWAMTGHALSAWMVVVLVIPMVLVMVREPLHNILHRRGPFHGAGALGGSLEVLIEGLEIVTGYFSSTLSFIRVGAFAISHAALCMAVYTLVALVADAPLGGVWQVLILVLGNLLVIVFEGMVDMIQCIRLEYYELFSKYFNGGGLAYSPFSLKGQKNE